MTAKRQAVAKSAPFESSAVNETLHTLHEENGALVAKLNEAQREREELEAALAQAQADNERLRKALQREHQLVKDQERVAADAKLLQQAIIQNVSHELNTPLLHVKAAVSMLAEDRADADTTENKAVYYATQAVAKLEAVIGNLMQLASSLNVQPKPIMARDGVDQALSTLRRSWTYRDSIGRVQVRAADRLPLVLGDRKALGIAVYQLIDNALKFSDAPIEVWVEKTADGWIEIGVRDDGIGIDPAQHERIFEPFFQVDSTSTRRYNGLGIGLALVRTVAERHSATVHVESDLGKGSTFRLLLAPAPPDL